jgi:hypothetical protein
MVIRVRGKKMNTYVKFNGSRNRKIQSGIIAESITRSLTRSTSTPLPDWMNNPKLLPHGPPGTPGNFDPLVAFLASHPAPVLPEDSPLEGDAGSVLTGEEVQTAKLDAKAYGKDMARWLFNQRGNHSEVSFSEVELINLLALAFEHGFSGAVLGGLKT